MSDVIMGSVVQDSGGAVNEEESVCPLCGRSYDRHEADPVRGTGEVRYWCPRG